MMDINEQILLPALAGATSASPHPPSSVCNIKPIKSHAAKNDRVVGF